jgi:hypothetical protein
LTNDFQWSLGLQVACLLLRMSLFRQRRLEWGIADGLLVGQHRALASGVAGTHTERAQPAVLDDVAVLPTPAVQ